MSMVDSITGPLRGVRAGMASTERQAGLLSGMMAVLTRTLLPVAVAAGIFLGALAPGVGVAGDFQAAISRVAAVAQATPAQMAKLEHAALELGASTAWTASQVAEAEKYLSMAGFTVDDNIAALPGVLGMASAGATDLGRAADISSDILSAFKMEASEMNRVADVLTATFTTSNTTLEMLGETMKYVGPVARKAGLSFEETSAMAGLLGNIGIKSTMAGTAMRTMLSNLAAPSSQAAKELEGLGVKTLDAAKNLRSPVLIMGELSAAMKNMGSGRQLSILDTLFGKEAMTGASEIIEQAGIGDLTKYIQIIENSAGTAGKVAKDMLNNFNGAKTMMGSAFEGLQISIGKIFLPVLTDLARTLTVVIGWMNTLAQTRVGKFIIAAAAGLSVGIIAVTAFSGAWAGLAFVLPVVKAALLSIAGAVGAISWPVWAVAAVVVGLYLAFKTNFMGIADIVKGWWDTIQLTVKGVLAVFASLSGGVGVIQGELAKDIKTAGLEGLVTTVARVTHRVMAMFSSAWEMIKMWVADIGGIFAPLKNAYVEAFSPLLTVFKSLGSVIATVVSALWGVQAASDVSTWETAGHVIGSVVGAAFHVLAYAVRFCLVPVDMMLGIIGGLIRAFVWLGESIGTAAGWVVEKFTLVPDAVAGAAERISNVFSTLVDGIKWVFMNLTPTGWIIQGITKLMGYLDGIDLTAAGAKLMETFTGGIKSALSAPVDMVKSALTKIGRFIPHSDAQEGPLSALTASGAAIMSTMAAGVRLGAPALQDAAKTAAAIAASALLVSGSVNMPVLTGASLPPAVEVSQPNIPVSGGATQGSGANNSGNITAGSNGTITIHIDRLELPGVADPAGFIAALRDLVEEYDV